MINNLKKLYNIYKCQRYWKILKDAVDPKIGIGKDVTHIFDASDDILKSNINEQIQFQLIHPNEIKSNNKFDNAISKKFFSIKPIERAKVNIFQKFIKKNSMIKKYIKNFISC